MMFGDAKRFGKSFVSSRVDSQVISVSDNATEDAVGPGAYFNSMIEEKRSGWASKSFSRRSPMSLNRSNDLSLIHSGTNNRDLYSSAIVTSYGAIAMPPSPMHHAPVPGPGYYNSNTNVVKSRPQVRGMLHLAIVFHF
jgi:hypothetical protein